MKQHLAIGLVLASILISAGCAGGEDASVKSAPQEVQTKTADEMGGGKTRRGEGSTPAPLGTERDSRAGG